VIDPELLRLLACPADKAPLREEGGRLVCEGCGLSYPVVDGIPVLLEEEARKPG
jgi:uncharacterized protein YbaR (Trm112 family)